jgi:SAM-dependent methyltransferase
MRASAQRAEKPDESPALIAAGPASHCTVCPGGDLEILQAQSLSLVGLGQCDIGFSLCKACGHLQQGPAVPPATMERHYAFFSHYTAFGDPESIRAAPPGALTSRLLSLVKDIGVAPGRAYEIGCATGLHLHHFRKAGWSVSGCDPSSKAVSQALDVYDIALDVGGEEACLPKQSGLDLVLMSHVLEHLYQPAQTVARVHEALRDGGTLVLEVPCTVAPELLPPAWFAFEHLHYFSYEVLEALLRNAGFEILEFRVAMRAFIYPVIAVAARKSGPPLKTPIMPQADATSRVARSFAALDAARWERTRERLSRISGEAYIWGAGVHTALLLFHTKLMDRVSVVAITDRDSQKWGHTQAGVPVISPDELVRIETSAPIIVSSFYAEREIVAALLDAGVARERIIPLYS